MSEAITMTEAARRLGISRVTLRRLVRDGRLPVTENPLDKRQKLIPEDAIARISGDRAGHRDTSAHESVLEGKWPWPETIGIVDDLGVRSDEVEAWLEANWRPC